MTNVTFEKAPLVEIAAQLRWIPEGMFNAPPIPGQPPGFTISTGGPSVDEFFMRFGGEIYQSKFVQAERLMPAGFPYLLHNAVYRYKENPKSSTFLQVGPGVMSANAVPPYKSWEDFLPTVEVGVKATLNARHESEKTKPFSTALLRYINAFSGELLNARAIPNFISETLGIKIVMPAPIDALIGDESAVKANLQFSFPIANMTKQMNLQIGEAMIHGTLSALMDVTISETAPIDPELSAIMGAFASSRKIIHDLFVEVTRPIHHLMKPSGEV